MSILARPSVVFAIVFGCFAVLIPRVFLPIFRTKPPTASPNFDDRFRRPPPPMTRGDHGDTIEHIPGSPPHIRGAHPGMRMHHPGAANARHQPVVEQTSSKSIVTLALPMYTVGIGVFFVYTCCKYWSRKSVDEDKMKNRCSSKSSKWINGKDKISYDILDQDSEDEGEKENLYAGLDPDYVEFLKIKKQKALEAQRAMTDEQKQMHQALEEMKKSLSYISSKLVNKESRSNLVDTDEISQLQDRLSNTEAQMCKILTALDSASEKVKKLNKPPAPIDDRSSSSENENNDDDDDEVEEDECSSEIMMENQSKKISYSNELEDFSSLSNSENSSNEDEDQSLPRIESSQLIHRRHH